MSVLPQLEQELRTAHERRRGGRAPTGRPRVAPSRDILALAVSVIVVIAVGGALLIGHRHSAPRPTPQTALTGGVVVSGLRGVGPAAYAAGGRLYVTQDLSPRGAREHDQLWSVEPRTGAILARRDLEGAFGQALLADGLLWVTSSDGPTRTWLWWLDAASLRPFERIALPGPGASAVLSQSLAIAGGVLWIASGESLTKVILPGGDAVMFGRRHGAGSLSVAADPAGRILLVSEGIGTAQLQRRDPRTGAVIAVSGKFDGVLRPYIGGFAGGYAWISEAGGMAGYATRIDVNALASTHQPTTLSTTSATPTLITGTNGLDARVLDGILWVTQQGGGQERNYCADPITGRRRATIPIGNTSRLLTVADGTVFYARPERDARYTQILRAPIPVRCR